MENEMDTLGGEVWKGSHNKDYSILGSISGFPNLGKPPFWVGHSRNTLRLCAAGRETLGLSR